MYCPLYPFKNNNGREKYQLFPAMLMRSSGRWVKTPISLPFKAICFHPISKEWFLISEYW
jgi:hypothetical protein